MRKKYNIEAIKEAVECLGGRRAFARALNISYQTSSEWVNGNRTPSLDNCLKIERATEGKIKAKNILPDYPLEELKQVE
jgi:DNA-binding transcriptional regulator YdaS (Cro superfamily)